MSKVQVDGCYFFLSLYVCSVRRVFLHLPGGSDQCFRAGWVHLWLHGLLHKNGRLLLFSPRLISFVFFYFISLNVKVWMFLSLQGEPHLTTAYALMMSYWEGIVHFILFLVIIHRMFSG